MYRSLSFDLKTDYTRSNILVRPPVTSFDGHHAVVRSRPVHHKKQRMQLKIIVVISHLEYIHWKPIEAMYSTELKIYQYCHKFLLPRACMRKRGKAIVLYVCWHENHHFGKSRDLGDSLASLFSQSVQKTAFSPLQIVWQSSCMS